MIQLMIDFDTIRDPAFVRTLDSAQLEELCRDIRGFLIQRISESGGHLASNLGAVELTVALHRVFDTSRDRLVFDVGHQCYTHKILTGRAAGFRGFRELGGMSGFPKPEESGHDAFVAGHASNSISAALGIARARTALGGDYDVVAVIGDGALGGGLALEGLSDAGHSGEPLIIVVNDNGMSINRAVGGFSDSLTRLRARPAYIRFKHRYRRLVRDRLPALYRFTHRVKDGIKARVMPENMFDDLGFDYIGPVDGHDIAKVEAALRWARAQRTPCIVHVITQKGRGYTPAERSPEHFHGVGAFDPVSGEPDGGGGEDFSAVFGETLTALAGEDSRVTAITAAMTEGTGLLGFKDAWPAHFYDVGIAEGHAVTMAAGMASRGLIPVFAVYSTFLQRAYDMLIHDAALMGLHVVLGVDRAGIVGRDGQTHQGTFDASFLATVPGMTVYAPSSFAELRSMLRRAVLEDDGPVAVRYPRGGEGDYRADASEAACTVLRPGADVTLVSYGIEINSALAAASILAERGVDAEVLKINRLTPLDCTAVLASVRKTGVFVAAEDVCRPGCVGERLLAAIAEAGCPIRAAKLINLGDGILANGAPEALRALAGLDGEGIARAVWEVWETYHGQGET